MFVAILKGVAAKPGRWLTAGIFATIVLATFMEGIARIVLGGPMKPADLISQVLGMDNSLFWLGEIMHYALGIIGFPIGYIVALAVTGMRGGIVSGVIWGFILWLAAATIMMSLAGQPLFFGFGKAMIASLVAHLAYGVVLGGLFGNAPLDPDLKQVVTP